MSVIEETSNGDADILKSEKNYKEITTGESNFCKEKMELCVSEDTSSVRVDEIHSERYQNDLLNGDKNPETDRTVRNISEKNIDLFETEERACKKLKLDNKTNEPASDGMESDSFQEIKKVPEDEAKIVIEVKKENGLESDMVKNSVELPSDEVMSLSEVNKSEVNNQEILPDEELNIKRAKTVKMHGYDDSKMTYEENCTECMYLYKDPTPADLCIYLHAVRYKVR